MLSAVCNKDVAQRIYMYFSATYDLWWYSQEFTEKQYFKERYPLSKANIQVEVVHIVWPSPQQLSSQFLLEPRLAVAFSQQAENKLFISSEYTAGVCFCNDAHIFTYY